MITLNLVYTYEKILSEMQELTCTYPDVLRFSMIGTSHDDRLIPMIQLGSSKSCLVISAGIHGRESVNPVLLLYMIEDYCKCLKEEKKRGAGEVTELFEQYSICFLPLVNPDGYEIAISGYHSIRNPVLRHSIMMDGIPAREWKCNGRGVDINRNFPCRSFFPRGRMLKAASENETRALMDLFSQIEDSIGYIDFHSRGKVIYYYRSAMPESYNVEGKGYAKKLSSISGYEIGAGADEFEDKSSGGNSVHYYSEVFNQMAITVETVEDEADFPLEPGIQSQTYEEIRNIPIAFLNHYKKD